jgi:hypothetical protein
MIDRAAMARIDKQVAAYRRGLIKSAKLKLAAGRMIRRQDEAASLFDRGHSVEEIAETMKIGVGLVRVYLKKSGRRDSFKLSTAEMGAAISYGHAYNRAWDENNRIDGSP